MAKKKAAKNNVEKSSDESFPASDPPSWTPVTGSGAPAEHAVEGQAPAPLAVRRVLHPTDFSPSSARAFTLACSLARDYSARLIVVHVVEAPTPIAGMTPVPPPVADRQLLMDQLRQIRPADDKLPFEHRLVEGGPVADEILRLAKDEKCDLIVMGTHGRRGLSRLLMGSVAEIVLREAPCPVLIARV